MFNIGIPELILIVIVALIIFGPRRLPELGSAIGRAIREFRKAMQGVEESLKPTVSEEEERKETKGIEVKEEGKLEEVSESKKRKEKAKRKVRRGRGRVSKRES